MIKVLNLKLLIVLEYQNTKPVLLKDMLQIGLKIFLWLKKLKIMFHGHRLLMINDLNGEKIIRTFYEKELQKAINKDLGLKKWLTEKETNYMWNGKDMIIYLISALIKKT